MHTFEKNCDRDQHKELPKKNSASHIIITISKTGNDLLPKFSITIDSSLGFVVATYRWLLLEDNSLYKKVSAQHYNLVQVKSNFLFDKHTRKLISFIDLEV